MPEGDSLHRAARRLQALVGERVEVETPHPRAAALALAERLDGKKLESVRAVGKNVLLEFEGGLVLRSHLRMSGRWRVEPRGTARHGRPWLVLRGAEREAVLWNGPVLELGDRRTQRLGPDILADPPDLDGIVARLRTEPGRELGDALLELLTAPDHPALGGGERAHLAATRPAADVGRRLLGARAFDGPF